MKIQTVSATPTTSKGEDTGVFTIKITGPFDSSNTTLQAARNIALRTGSTKMLESLDRSIERMEIIEKDNEG
ncbi:hypothetical protein [Bradyrhizobium sp. BR 10289]|uniref:hypothetical protein n=1 Tax=Bradyrhizobium sp. BR 10289 TaxID=2749993 RepID=UPI001C651E25|nr:hypothetical protein [Bradyrhizobium sp. BR 10289]MBW7974064.1 hypothetical protein [Bradyrhizobium sp. BR 10289]